MQLDFFMLARHAEAHGDLFNILGGGFDTMTIRDGAPPPPDGGVAVLSGTIAARVLFHQVTETNRNYKFGVTLVDEDGAEVGALGGEFPLVRAGGIPVGWPQNVNLVLPLGIVLPRFGTYTFSLAVDGRHLGDRTFRVMDGRSAAGSQAA